MDLVEEELKERQLRMKVHNTRYEGYNPKLARFFPECKEPLTNLKSLRTANNHAGGT